MNGKQAFMVNLAFRRGFEADLPAIVVLLMDWRN